MSTNDINPATTYPEAATATNRPPPPEYTKPELRKTRLLLKLAEKAGEINSDLEDDVTSLVYLLDEGPLSAERRARIERGEPDSTPDQDFELDFLDGVRVQPDSVLAAEVIAAGDKVQARWDEVSASVLPVLALWAEVRPGFARRIDADFNAAWDARKAELHAAWKAVHDARQSDLTKAVDDRAIEREAFESGVGRTTIFLATFRGLVVGYGTTETAAKRETERHAKHDRSAPADLVDHLVEVVIERVEAETAEALAEITDGRCTPEMATNVEYAIWSSKAEDAMPADRRRARLRRSALCGLEVGVAMALSSTRDIGWTHDDLVEQFGRLVAAHRKGGRAAMSALVDEVR